MRIVVAGATGVVGRLLVDQATRAGDDVVSVSRSTGQDVTTGAGLEQAVSGADVVIDVTSVRTTSTRVSTAFFREATTNLLAAEQAAGVRHHIALSIVGIDGFTSGYYAGKQAQERLVTAGPVPWTLLRATQFHEFVGQVLDQARLGPIAVVPGMRVATIAAEEVAAALLSVAHGPPAGRPPDLGGPQEFTLLDLARAYIAARRLRTRALPLPVPGRGGQLLRDGALLPGPDATRGRVTFTDWLSRP